MEFRLPPHLHLNNRNQQLMNGVKITIENPCGEDISQMKPTQRGRFCGSCERDLVDFTKLNDRDIQKVIHQTNGDVCGWFRPDQLDRQMVELPVASSPAFFKYAASVLLTMAIGNSTAQNNQIPMPSEKTEQTIGEVVQGLKPYFISGKIIDERTSETLPFAVVRIQETELGMHSDLEGNFSLEIPKKFRSQELTLKVSYAGYQQIEMKLDPDSLQFSYQEMVFQMQSIVLNAVEICVLDEVVVVGEMSVIQDCYRMTGVPAIQLNYLHAKTFKWWQFRKRRHARMELQQKSGQKVKLHF
ncbi:MAG: hypothetical protein ACI8TS_000571 [Flavobacteriales bacterium]